MKRILSLFLLIIMGISSTGCSITGDAKMNKDQKNAKKTLDCVVEAAKAGDTSALTSLFSEESLSQTPCFEKDALAFFEYFSGGTVKAYNDYGGPIVSSSEENGLAFQSMECSYDITTEKCTYRFAIKIVTEDDINPKNEGIWSVYVIKLSEDVNPDLVYWGDGKNTPGIHIGIPNAE